MDDATKAQLLNEMILDCEAKLKGLHAQLELEQRYLADLRARRARLSGIAAPATNAMASRSTGSVQSLPEAVKSVLQETGEPMRAKDIAQQLVRKGYRSSAKHGLLPSVLSALGRRDDLFENVSRGVYRLRQTATGQE